MATTTSNGTVNAAAAAILNAPILNDAPARDTLQPWQHGIYDMMNAGPGRPAVLQTQTFHEYDKNGVEIDTHVVAFETNDTDEAYPEHVYAVAGSGKNVVSLKTDWTDKVLEALAMVKGGTRAYLVLGKIRDKQGFPKVDAKLAGKFRKSAERLMTIDKAAAHRFDYQKFTVLPASDDAPKNIGGYLRIVFTGTRVK